jgi:hypothetical protein
MEIIFENLSLNEIKKVFGGDCLCECHHPVRGWNHPQSKKGMSPSPEHCHNILCSDSQWDTSTCTDISSPYTTPLDPLSIISGLSTSL